ncbi:putative pentatricopeptide repeat-containing protein At1g68930 [Cryptomeria japonica]|uniref:putative pentatricopeptide repeat-containing protein At1g68930 n=1 Tax=Cryptomeria japonica TaxID=3369 RepID=UPI0027DA27EF|nr:putative pentatricopeptide repeat-containing protein At1g68930 [Cryptomeria japonica]
MIVGYVQNGLLDQGFELFKKMQLVGVKPDTSTFASILPTCAKLGALEQGMEIHQKGFLSNVVVVTSLIDMYVKCGCIQNGYKMFDNKPQRDVASWNAMIVGYTQNGLADKTLEMFKQMQFVGVKPDTSTFASILPACAKLGGLEQGMEIHQKIIDSRCLSDIVVTALIDMYGKCGSIQKARELFDKMHHPGAVSWNAMIAGYTPSISLNR